MSPRRNRRNGDRRTPEQPVRGPRIVDQVEQWPDGEWLVRQLAGSDVPKVYRCPGCDQAIPARMPHVVAWPADAGSVDERRHWHTPCWRARGRRGPRVPRSR